jgi:hypothetical protein
MIRAPAVMSTVSFRRSVRPQAHGAHLTRRPLTARATPTRSEAPGARMKRRPVPGPCQLTLRPSGSSHASAALHLSHRLPRAKLPERRPRRIAALASGTTSRHHECPALAASVTGVTGTCWQHVAAAPPAQQLQRAGHRQVSGGSRAAQPLGRHRDRGGYCTMP